MMARATVGIRELKAQLGYYLRQVKDGTTLIITERGKPVGRIVPEQLPAQARVRELVEAGLINWSGRKLGPIKQIARAHGGRTVADLLLENRE